jgi:hypothetical protein
VVLRVPAALSVDEIGPAVSEVPDGAPAARRDDADREGRPGSATRIRAGSSGRG